MYCILYNIYYLQFKSDPSKMLSIIGWMVIYCSKEEDEPEHFKLTSGDGSVNKYHATTAFVEVWVQRLQTATTQQHPKVSS